MRRPRRRPIPILTDSGRRLRQCATRSTEFPTKPSNWFLEIWATATAIVREVSYPQPYMAVRWLRVLSPPPLGRVIFLLGYWAVVIYIMTWDAIVNDAYFWERIGFRNGWATITQIPLLYLLASKSSVLAILAGSSYERINWLHRWVARTVFVSASVHGWHFYTEWARADFVQMELKAMPMVRWGLGAWGILLFQLLVSLWPVRRFSYELFVAQHVASAVVFLWVVYVHVPSYARYNVWFAVAALCFDRVCRAFTLVWRNVGRFGSGGCSCARGPLLGHAATVRALGDAVSVVTIQDVHFAWRPGQHVYLCLPRVGPAETHPYTIASAHQAPRGGDGCVCNSIELVVRKHRGFSARLHAFAARARAEQAVTAIVLGPYGRPSRWDVYETLVLIAASTGASFTLPILESVLRTRRTNCTKRIDFLLAARQRDDVQFYLDRLPGLMVLARNVGVRLLVHVALTGSSAAGSVHSPTGSVSSSYGDKGKDAAAVPEAHIHMLSGRPNIEAFIRIPVEATGGETSVVVCGGPSLVATVRNCVASLSDERAVHKGTGAQGIQLHVEEYCF